MTNQLSPEAVKDIRRRLGYTQSLLGRRMGVEARAVRRWEMQAGHSSSRDCIGTSATLLRLFDFFGREWIDHYLDDD